VNLLYGTEYIDSISVLRLHIWSCIPVFLGVASSQFLIIENLQKLAFYRTTIGCLLNVSLNIILIPLFDSIGAAIATVLSYFFATFSFFFFKETRFHARLLINSLNPQYWIEHYKSSIKA
jgi:PST family polysaccharide transporter